MSDHDAAMKSSLHQWIGATAVAAALAELVAEGAFTEGKALELAHMYLHDNAAKLYGEMK